MIEFGIRIGCESILTRKAVHMIGILQHLFDSAFFFSNSTGLFVYCEDVKKADEWCDSFNDCLTD